MRMAEEGKPNYNYVADIAKQGRAKCKDKDCKQTIPKGELRIGKEGFNPFNEDSTLTSWYHPDCYFRTQARMRKGSAKIESTDDIKGFDELPEEAQQRIADLIKNGPPELEKKEEKPKKAASKKKGTKRKSKKDEEEEEEEGEGAGEDEEEPPKKKAKGKSKAKAKAKAKSKKSKKKSEEEEEGEEDDE